MTETRLPQTIASEDPDRKHAFNQAMIRGSVFIPAYMNRLLAMVAARQGEGKAKFIRNAILRELKRYLLEVEHANGGKYDPLPTKGDARPIKDDAMYVGHDTESDENWARALYDEFAKQDDKFPDPVQLHFKRR